MLQIPAPVRYLLITAAGALATLAFAPFNLPYLSLVSVLFSYLLLFARSESLLLGWLYGLGYFGAGVSWVYVSIHYHGGMGILASSLMTGAFCGALALLFAVQFRLYRRLFRQDNPLGFAALWLLFEWLRSWLLTGFPWLLIGTAWVDTPLARLAPLGGVWLVSLSVLIIAALLAQTIITRRASRLTWPLLLFASCYLLPSSWTVQGQAVQVALLQPNTPLEIKWSHEQVDRNIDRLVAMSDRIAGPGLVIWPETAIPKLINDALPSLSPLLNRMEQRNQTLITGFPRRVWDPQQQRWLYHNSLGVLTGALSLYDKQRLVPFGEYLPFERLLRGTIEFFNLPMSSFSLPLQTQHPLEVNGVRIGAAICYEIAYPELVREQARNSAILVTLSNDSWFAHSHGPAQHLQIARMRAIENGRWVIRGTNDGYSALIDASGRLVAQAEPYIPATLVTNAYLSIGTTPYQRLGNLPALTLASLCLLGGLVYSRRGRALKQSRPTA